MKQTGDTYYVTAHDIKSCRCPGCTHYRTSQGRTLAVQPAPNPRQGQEVQRKETDDRV
jgi:hypothetical protein